MTSVTQLPDDDALRHPDTGHVLLAVLAQGRHAARLSLLLAIAAVAFLGLSVIRQPGTAESVAQWTAAWRTLPAAALWLSLLVGMVQRYYALRVRLDARLFGQIYTHPAVTDQDLQRMDEGLALLGEPKGAPPRGLRSRWTGALRLLRRQMACCAVQAACLLAAGALAWLR